MTSIDPDQYLQTFSVKHWKSSDPAVTWAGGITGLLRRH